MVRPLGGLGKHSRRPTRPGFFRFHGDARIVGRGRRTGGPGNPEVRQPSQEGLMSTSKKTSKAKTRKTATAAGGGNLHKHFESERISDDIAAFAKAGGQAAKLRSDERRVGNE